MRRYYFISDDIDSLARIEVELKKYGIIKPRLHVLSKDGTASPGDEQYHDIAPVLKQDLVHGVLINIFIGALAAVLVLAIGYITRLPDSYTWAPFFLLAITVFGFVSWSGRCLGPHVLQKDFRRFQKELDDGKHIFIVDVDSSQKEVIRQMEYENPYLIDAGSISVAPRWIHMVQKNFKDNSTSTVS